MGTDLLWLSVDGSQGVHAIELHKYADASRSRHIAVCGGKGTEFDLQGKCKLCYRLVTRKEW